MSFDAGLELAIT